MRIVVIIIVIILVSSVPIFANDNELNGIYEKIGSNSYEITVYLPSSHYNIKVVETNYTIENSKITNVVNFLVNEKDLLLLKQSFTISGDSGIDYQVYLDEKFSGTNQDLKIFEFIISFIFGAVFLFILYRTLTRQFKEINNH